jgi:hypothetical protein
MSNTSGLPLTYPDLACVGDLDAFGSETGSDLETLEQDVYHILIEEPGSNPDDPTRGIGVESLLSGDISVLQAVPRQIEAQLMKDDRVDQCKASLAQIPAGGAFSDGTPVGDSVAYELTVEIVPSGSVLPISLAFGFTPIGGLSWL